MAEIRDPVHGYIKITDVERKIIDSPFIQRLRRIHQLAGAYLVYPGAVHTRFDHVIGTMHIAGLIAQSLSRTADISETQKQEIRLAALLHDVGHGPFSHLYEEVLSEKTNITHEDISQKIVLETSIRDILEKNGYSAREMSYYCVGKGNNKPPFMNEIIAGGLSADIMDYLLRDSYFTGVEYGKVDIHRIIDSLEVVDGHIALDHAALYAFEALLIARYEMFKAVYFHRTVRAAELMLVHSMILADQTLGLTNLSNIDNYLDMTDEVVLHKLSELSGNDQRLNEAKRLAQDFKGRNLLKCVFEKFIQHKSKGIEQLFAKRRVREQIILDLADRAKIDPLHIYLDVPTTPSVPYTYGREALKTITFVHKDDNKKSYEVIPIESLPLIGAITGFMDVLRIYTRAEYRKKVAKAIEDLFGVEGFMTRISV